MRQHVMSEQRGERRFGPAKGGAEYYSAEFAIDGLNVLYQFRILNSHSSSMAVLVKETSDILPHLKVGDTLNVRYYSERSPYPSSQRTTEVRHITKNEEGRLKGHYLIGLEIVDPSD